MIKFFLIVSLLISSVAVASDHSPGSTDPIPESEDDTFYDLNFLYMKKAGLYRYIGEIKIREAYGDLHHYQYFLRGGANYRLSTHFKVGLSYQLQQGVRHDDSWVKENGLWFWHEDEANAESVLLPEVTYRAMILDKVRFDLRLRYSWNVSENLRTIKTRPGLTYFKFKNGKPYLNYYAMYEHYWPTNFGNYSTYQQWLYFGFLYHQSKQHMWGLYYSYGRMTWTDSLQVKKSHNEISYEVDDNIHLLGVKYIISK